MNIEWYVLYFKISPSTTVYHLIFLIFLNKDFFIKYVLICSIENVFSFLKKQTKIETWWVRLPPFNRKLRSQFLWAEQAHPDVEESPASVTAAGNQVPIMSLRYVLPNTLGEEVGKQIPTGITFSLYLSLFNFHNIAIIQKFSNSFQLTTH